MGNSNADFNILPEMLKPFTIAVFLSRTLRDIDETIEEGGLSEEETFDAMATWSAIAQATIYLLFLCGGE